MLFIVSGHDKPGNLDERLRLRPQHRAYYERLGADLILSGPYLDEEEVPVGSMIIMRASSQIAAEAFAHADPYVTEGVFETVTVWHWEWFMNRPPGFIS